MDTNLKNAIAAMREEIAALEKEQKNIKPQRKTVHFTGERTMHPYTAAEQVKTNKDKLRLYYAAYGLLRGKNFDVTENKARPLDRDYYYNTFGIWVNENLIGKHPLFLHLNEINDILRNYGYEFKNYETKTDVWGGTYKTVSTDKYEEVICIGE